MRDTIFENACRRLKAEGPCSFDVKHNAQFEWMQSQCFMWTGGQLNMIAARTLTAQVRILPVGEDRLIVWDYDHLGQTEYIQFLLQFDNDDDLKSLAHFALYKWAARVLLGGGYIIHSGQLLRGAQRAVPDIAEIEARHRREKPYDSEPITVAGYLLFFHEEGHYLFCNPSRGQDTAFQRASNRIEELRNKAEQSLKEGDFSSICSPCGTAPFPGREADGDYPRNIIDYLDKHQRSPVFVEEVACDLFAIEQLLKAYPTESTPAAVARRYCAIMMHYQIQATLEGLRQRYEKIEHPEESVDIELDTENQIRNDIRGFYFRDMLFEILNPKLSFWLAYEAEITRVYAEGVRERYWRLILPVKIAVMAKACDKAWLAECEQRERKLDASQRKEIRRALAEDFDLRFW